jgi:hypothetical protein
MANPSKTTIPPFKNREDAPIIYFDLAPAFGVMAGAVQIELSARTLTPVPDSTEVLIEFITAARLRCSPAAARLLRSSIDEALKMIEQPGGQPGPAVGTGQLH